MNLRMLWYGLIIAVMPCVMASESGTVQFSQEELEAMLKPMKAFEQMPPLDTIKPLMSIDQIPYVSAESYFEYFFTQQAKKWVMLFTVSEDPIDIDLEWAAYFCKAEALVVLDALQGDIVRAKQCSAEERQHRIVSFIECSIQATREHVEDILVQEQVDSILRQFRGLPEGINMKDVYTNTSGVTIPLFVMDALCQQHIIQRVNELIATYKSRSADNNEVLMVVGQALARFMEILQQEQQKTAVPASQK